MPIAKKAKCSVKKTMKVTTGTGAKKKTSTFKKTTRSYGSVSKAKKAAEKISKKGKRVRRKKVCDRWHVYEGPNRKAVTLKSGQRLSGTKKK